MKLIKLTNVDLFVKVDDKHYEELNKYAFTGTFEEGILTGVVTSFENKKANTTIPQLILKLNKANEKLVVVFKDFDILNCQEDNLLFIPRSLAVRYKSPGRDSTSKYKGVSYDKSKSKWLANLIVKGEKVLNARFAKEDDAARAYNNACIQYYNGECFLNTIGIDNRSLRVLHEYKDESATKRRRKRSLTGNYKGVCKEGNKFTARTTDTLEYIGIFDTAEDAARAYDKVMFEKLQNAEYLNFPEDYL